MTTLLKSEDKYTRMKYQVKENLRLFWKLNLQQGVDWNFSVPAAKTDNSANLQEHFSNNSHETAKSIRRANVFQNIL